MNENKINQLENQIQELRRDVDDLHSIIMLKTLSEKIPKKNLIVFLGTGQINENVLHAYIYFQQSIKKQNIEFDGEALFIAKNRLEYDLIKAYELPCIEWQHQPDLTIKLLEAKAVVLSSHLYSNWGDNLLRHCLSNAIKIQLWHGLPAKEIGKSVINNNMHYHFFARLLEDCVTTNHICIQNKTVSNVYKDAFPLAVQHITGDIRTDMLFDEDYRNKFINNKRDKSIMNWIKDNNKIKILYTPTYRESVESTLELYARIFDLFKNIDSSKILFAIKPHVGINFSDNEKNSLNSLCQKKGFLYIDNHDEVYSTFYFFDAIMTDYSSIRSDFSLTGKPILLWQFDKEHYERKTNSISEFQELDEVSYTLDNENITTNTLLDIIQTDPLREKRKNFVNSNIKYFSDGQAAKRIINVCIDILNSN